MATKTVSKVVLIGKHAKATRKAGEKWPAAIKRSTKELKQAGKI
jgi:hypothetical protein